MNSFGWNKKTTQEQSTAKRRQITYVVSCREWAINKEKIRRKIDYINKIELFERNP